MVKAQSRIATNTSENKIFEVNGEEIIKGEIKNIRLTFFDKGLGISEDFIDRVANPFFSTKPQGEGTGLGLSISHGIIKNHGGNLWFESQKGEYTKAIVDLPANNNCASQVEI